MRVFSLYGNIYPNGRELYLNEVSKGKEGINNLYMTPILYSLKFYARYTCPYIYTIKV